MASEALKAVQAEEKMHAETISKARQLIGETREKIKAATVPDRRGDLEKQRADCIARLALGENVEDRLAEIGGEIARHETDVKDSEKVIAPARAAVEGLTRRLQQEQETLRRLTADHEQARRDFLHEELEAAGERCRRAADEYHAAFARLVALDMLSGSGLVSQSTRYVSPVLPLAAFNDVRGRDCLHDIMEITGSGKAEVHLAAERKRLRDLGVEI